MHEVAHFLTGSIDRRVWSSDRSDHHRIGVEFFDYLI
jgi:hypothetical protein